MERFSYTTKGKSYGVMGEKLDAGVNRERGEIGMLKKGDGGDAREEVKDVHPMVRTVRIREEIEESCDKLALRLKFVQLFISCCTYVFPYGNSRCITATDWT